MAVINLTRVINQSFSTLFTSRLAATVRLDHCRLCWVER